MLKEFLIWVLYTLTFLCLGPKEAVEVAASELGSTQNLYAMEGTVEAADVLLIYGSNLSMQEMQSIEVIVKSMTYLQRSIVFLPAYQSINILDEYENIICYKVDTDDDEAMKALARLDKNIFILGGDAVSGYIQEKEYEIKTIQKEDVFVSVGYAFSEIKSFSKITNFKRTTFLEGAFTYQSGSIEFGNKTVALYSGLGDFRYTPCIDLRDEIMSASFAYETAIWLWPYNGKPHSYSQYIVLNEVYPFYPPEYLLEIVDYCIENRLSFILSVMPIYENGDYPSMKRFCEVLRYAQANGGSIILHLPNIVAQGDNLEQLWEYLTYATEAYTNFGVYPLGIQVPENYLFDETGREVLKRYTTVFCYRDFESSKFDVKERFNNIYRDGHILVAPAYTINQEQNVQFETLSTAAYINVSNDIPAIKKQIISSVHSDVVHKSLWDLDNTVYADNLYYYTRDGEIFFNDEKMSLEYTPFTYEKYRYDSGVFKWIAKDLSGLNKKLAFIAITSSIIFIVFIIVGRYRIRKRFLLPREEGDKDGLA